MRHFLALRPYFRRQAWRYAFGVLALLGADAAQLIQPQILERFVNTIQTEGVTVSSILPDALWLAFLAFVIFTTRFLWRNLVQGAARVVDFELRGNLFSQFTRLSPNYFNHKKTGDLMAHATNDLQAVRGALSMGIVALADSVFLISATLIIMFSTISVPLSLWALLPLPLAGIVTGMMGREIHNRFLAVQNQFSNLSDHVQENFAGIRIVKSFVQEDAELDRLMAESGEYKKRNLLLVKLWALIDPLVDFIQGCAFVIALALGGAMVIRGQITLGAFVAFTSYLSLLAWPMQSIGFLVNLVQRASASLERLETIFKEKPEITEDPSPIQPKGGLTGAVSFRGVNFTYPGSTETALKEISFELGTGQTLAIIGRTGCGKSTILNLILRIFNPPDGTVFMDGVDVKKLPLGLLRESIGYVPPDNFLFSESIAQNIAFGLGLADPTVVEEAADLAQVKENIVSFPKGFETLLGERGITLSGGQKQRVSLARAIAKNPALLILDDSFSAVDTRTEEAILSGLKRLRQGRSTIIVAHRVSTISHADQILVMDEGQIVERGTHEDLLRQDGAYAAMYRRQLIEDRVQGQEEVGA